VVTLRESGAERSRETLYAHNEPALVKRLLDRKLTCFAMERVPRIARAQSMDARSSQSALATNAGLR
jgi:NAD/NADP transhydrogenase alpha subunit